MKVDIFDDARCVLGEGPIWDSSSQELRWVDIKSRKYTQKKFGWRSVFIFGYHQNAICFGNV